MREGTPMNTPNPKIQVVAPAETEDEIVGVEEQGLTPWDIATESYPTLWKTAILPETGELAVVDDDGQAVLSFGPAGESNETDRVMANAVAQLPSLITISQTIAGAIAEEYETRQYTEEDIFAFEESEKESVTITITLTGIDAGFIINTTMLATSEVDPLEAVTTEDTQEA